MFACALLWALDHLVYACFIIDFILVLNCEVL